MNRPPHPPEPASALARLRRQIVLAWFGLCWERLVRAGWSAATVTCLFLALALFQILPGLPGWLHSAVLAGFAGTIAALLACGLWRFRQPSRLEALRRLEQDNDLPHRPLQTLLDRVAGRADPVSDALWRRHCEQITARIGVVRVGLPRPGLAARDPWALRAAAGLVLFVAGAGTWGDWGDRLESAFSPRFSTGGARAVAVLDAWISPPTYTGLAPIFLKTEAALAGAEAGTPAAPVEGAVPTTPIGVPYGSQLVARVSGTGGAMPALRANERWIDFTAIDADHHQVTQSIHSGDRVAVSWQGNSLGDWPIRIIADQPPSIAFATAPEGTSRAALKIDYQAGDDYGVTGLQAVITPEPEPQQGADGASAAPLATPAPLTLDLGAPANGSTQIRTAGFHDLTAHPWAGLPAAIHLAAADGAGQIATTELRHILLPARVFSHPVARRIVEERRRLTREGERVQRDVGRVLFTLTEHPDAYHGDLVVHLALRVAGSRLFNLTDEDVIPSTQTLMWDVALRLEDGGVSLAERDLRAAQQALAEALERNAGEAELRKLMDELQVALDRYLDAMDQQAGRKGKDGGPATEIPPELAQQMVGREDLQALMDQMRSLAETGSRDAAREMLARLQQTLENLQAAETKPPPEGQNPTLELMKQVQELARREQELLDRTYRQSQAEDPSAGGNAQQRRVARTQSQNELREITRQQGEVRQQLGEIMRQLGEKTAEIPKSLGNADQSMRQAEKSLRSGLPGDAVAPQGEAVQQLQQGVGDMAKQMMEQMYGMDGSPGSGQGPGQRGRDPLGRPLPSFGAMDNGNVKIPDQGEVQRAREILDELRRRAGEARRPRLELDYIDRLLRQF